MFGPSLTTGRQVLILIALTLAMVLPGLASLPVIDRDEARYAQASVQMAESGDWLNIRFQDEARNKKPAGAYWAQTVMIKAFTKDGERKIWVQRLPSVLASLATILLLFWGGSKLVGREAAFIGAALLAVSFIFVFEGHIAKTDALLCASTTAIFAALARLRMGGGHPEVWAFWIALGLSIMIKGPIGLVLAGFTLVGLSIWERDLRWAKPLLNIGAIVVFLLIWLPWAIAMFLATDGAFFAESLGNDLGGKVVGAQENHGGLPGYHLLAVFLTLWPASLFLLPGLVHAVRTVRQAGDGEMAKAMQLCLVWVVPFWLVIEVMPTKLPHYALPVFPALCLMMGAALVAMKAGNFKLSRRIGGLLYVLVSLALIIALLTLQLKYGELDDAGLTYLVLLAGGVCAVIAALTNFMGRLRSALMATCLSGLFLSVGAYAHILPSLEEFRTSERLAATFQQIAPDITPAVMHSPHYAEPSLVYQIGKDIDVTARPSDLSQDRIIILDALRKDFDARKAELFDQPAEIDLCVSEAADPVTGFNYSKGDAVELTIWQVGPCPASETSPRP